MNKKGMSDLFLTIIISLVLVVEITFTLWGFVAKIQDNTAYEQEFLARDMATIINSVYASSGDVLLNYPSYRNTFRFSYDFSANEVSVSDAKKSFEATYHFVEDTSLKFTYTSLYPGSIENKGSEESVRPLFIKRGSTISVEDGNTYKFEDKRDCSYIEAEWDYRSIVLLTGPASAYKAQPESFRAAVDVVLLFKRGKNQDRSENPVNAYISSTSSKRAKSEKLACIILKVLEEDAGVSEIISGKGLSPITSFNIIPTEDTFFDKDKIMVVFEIGNEGSEKNLDEEAYNQIVLKIKAAAQKE